MTTAQLSTITGLFTGNSQGKLAGIPGIFKMGMHRAKQGIADLLQFLAMLSMSLCLLNLLPIPALDGGRALFLTIESIIRRPINQTIEQAIHTVSFVLLLGLMVFVSVRDLL